MGFHGVTITRLNANSIDPFPCPPFLAHLPAATDIARFRSIKYIGNCAVVIQKYRPNSSLGTQCFRCQNFGHASRNCNLPARCVKCIDDHASKDCPKKDRSTPAQCCNCKEEHPANYVKCAERQRYISRLKEQNNVRHPMISLTPKIQITAGAPAVTAVGKPWNQIVKSTPRTHPLHPECVTENTQNPDETTKEILLIMTIIKNIRAEFVQCKSMIDKIALILSHLGNYV